MALNLINEMLNLINNIHAFSTTVQAIPVLYGKVPPIMVIL